MGEMAAFVVLNLIPSLRHAMKWHPEVIHVHFAVPTGVLGWVVSLVTGTPYVLTTQLGDIPGGVPDQTDLVFTFIKPLTVPIWNHAAAVTAPSDHIRELALKSYNVEIETIPNGIDLGTVKQSPREPHSPRRLVFAGRFNPQKNLLFLIDLLERVSDLDWEMEMLGDGPLMDAVRARIHSAGLTDRIRMPGWVEPETVETTMSESDILVLPSLSEGLPIVGTRALGTGLAILASDIGGNRDVVQDGLNGFLCDLTDIDSFEKALRRLLTSDEPLVSMKRESRRLAEKFDVQAIGSRFEQVFEASVR
jgi:glycosyltransferase involved in cell wall biosynthesis